MTSGTATHRRSALLVALLAAVLALTGLGAPAATAAPGDTHDDEGGTAALREQLDAASRGYLDAAAALEKSRTTQRRLAAELKNLQADTARRTAAVEEMAIVAYRTGRLGALSALVGSESPDSFVDRALALNVVASTENTALRQLAEVRDRTARAKTAIDTEMRQQQTQLGVMAARKKQAEQALDAAEAAAAARARAEAEEARRVRANDAANSAPTARSPRARPAPRNPDGSWPPESCSQNDPTTSGCITPRTLHALNQAKAAGFTRYVSCFRSGSSGEHPRGRACDWAAQANGFGGAATGGDRTYGNNLAAYFISNANRLGVLYVIWYRRIWLPSSGWRSYSGRGSPSAEHTNHVHLSVY